MTKRKLIIVGVALLIVVGARLGQMGLAKSPEREKPAPKEQIVTVITDKVKLETKTVEVQTTGSLQAKERMELLAEVQGLMLPDGGRFKAGTSYSRGQSILAIRSDDARAQVVSQRSTFERGLTTVMADIRLDYPEAYDTWSAYLSSIDVNKRIPELPIVTDSKLKSFLTGRDIYTSYYSLRNAEINLSKYSITAPFSGILISANANPGTVIRPGQVLGEFIKPDVYELKASTDMNTVKRLSRGQTVNLKDEQGKPYTGMVSRVNESIDPATQMSDFFVEISSEELREGQFLQLMVEGQKVDDVYEISRSALRDSRYAFVVENDVLRMVELEILHTTRHTALVRGLENNQEVLTKIPPAAFSGMKVKIYSEASES